MDMCVCVCVALCLFSLQRATRNKKNALLFKMNISSRPKKEVPFLTKWDVALKLKVIFWQLVFILDGKRGNEP